MQGPVLTEDVQGPVLTEDVQALGVKLRKREMYEANGEEGPVQLGTTQDSELGN